MLWFKNASSSSSNLLFAYTCSNVFFYNKNYLIPEAETNLEEYDEERVVNFTIAQLIGMVNQHFEFIEAE